MTFSQFEILDREIYNKQHKIDYNTFADLLTSQYIHCKLSLRNKTIGVANGALDFCDYKVIIGRIALFNEYEKGQRFDLFFNDYILVKDCYLIYRYVTTTSTNLFIYDDCEIFHNGNSYYIDLLANMYPLEKENS